MRRGELLLAHDSSGKERNGMITYNLDLGITLFLIWFGINVLCTIPMSIWHSGEPKTYEPITDIPSAVITIIILLIPVVF